ncbi:hypothetical protein [Chishuiella sp.]|uniref:hypothetical protein n=1 Tax=Chishuiella sp. TaxID=1969467 RepID=UPI0028A5D4B8|nr:hypothetical protein [Chishuiella sp.]
MTIEQFIIENELQARVSSAKQLRRVELLFEKYLSEIIRLYGFNANLDDLTPQLKKEFENLTKKLSIDLEKRINVATKEQWLLAQSTATKFVNTFFEVDNLKEATQQIFRNTHLEQYFEAQKSRLNKFKLSDRVWKYSKQFETNVIDAFEIALKNGDSAQKLSRDLKQYLKNPDALFRRVRDEKGMLHLSKNATAYNPGQGVYRSASKNALRLASSEINAFYKEAENTRWASMDFVVGIEIKRSNNFFDCKICEPLKGKYPKTFKFSGWHTQCRCYQIPILKPIEMFTDELKGAVKEDYSHLGSFQKTEITKMPANFVNHLNKNAGKYKGYKTIPYWVKG